MLKDLTNGNDYKINDSQSDIVEELIHVETDAMMFNARAYKSGQPNQMLGNRKNQSKNVTQTEIQIEPSPHSLRKIKGTHWKNYIYM